MGLFKSIFEIPSAVSKSIGGSSMLWGLGATSRSWAGKLAVPGLIMGAFGIQQVVSNTLGAGYSLDDPLARWSSTEGLSQPVNSTMGFARTNWTSMQNSANGNLAFALHNMRKG